MKHLVLVRHGQTEWNVQRRIQGQAGSGLSSLGVEQAQRTATWLAETYPDAQLFSSDLQRCRETAAPLAEALATTPELLEGLRERDFGDWSGRLLTEVESGYPELWTRWRAGEDVVAEVGGESSAALASRVCAAYARILRATVEAGIAIVVTHGGPVWHGTHALLGIEEGILGGVANTSITEVVQGGDGRHRLSAWNQLGHLPPRLRTFLRPVDGRPTDRVPRAAAGSVSVPGARLR